MDNIKINDEIEGYIYVFPFNDKYARSGRSIQYKNYENIKPIDTMKIKFSNFKYYYIINQNKKSNNHKELSI